jgi:hypothetical protein
LQFPASNLIPGTGYAKDFRRFSQSLQTNEGIEAQIKRHPISCASFLINYFFQTVKVESCGSEEQEEENMKEEKTSKEEEINKEVQNRKNRNWKSVGRS